MNCTIVCCVDIWCDFQIWLAFVFLHLRLDKWFVVVCFLVAVWEKKSQFYLNSYLVLCYEVGYPVKCWNCSVNPFHATTEMSCSETKAFVQNVYPFVTGYCFVMCSWRFLSVKENSAYTVFKCSSSWVCWSCNSHSMPTYYVAKKKDKWECLTHFWAILGWTQLISNVVSLR